MADVTKDVKVERKRDCQVTICITVKAPAGDADDVVGAVLKQIAGKWDDGISPPNLGPIGS